MEDNDAATHNAKVGLAARLQNLSLSIDEDLSEELDETEELVDTSKELKPSTRDHMTKTTEKKAPKYAETTIHINQCNPHRGFGFTLVGNQPVGVARVTIGRYLSILTDKLYALL